MAAKTFQCRLITPTAKVLDEPVTYASVPAWDGLFGVLPGRAPIVAKLGVGELRLDFPDTKGAAGGSRSFVIDEGFAQMVGDRLTILANQAVPVESLVEADAKADLAKAEVESGVSEARNRRVAFARVKSRLAHRARGKGI